MVLRGGKEFAKLSPVELAQGRQDVREVWGALGGLAFIFLFRVILQDDGIGGGGFVKGEDLTADRG